MGALRIMASPRLASALCATLQMPCRQQAAVLLLEYEQHFWELKIGSRPAADASESCNLFALLCYAALGAGGCLREHSGLVGALTPAAISGHVHRVVMLCLLVAASMRKV